MPLFLITDGAGGRTYLVQDEDQEQATVKFIRSFYGLYDDNIDSFNEIIDGLAVRELSLPEGVAYEELLLKK
jgi:hypothetical protein